MRDTVAMTRAATRARRCDTDARRPHALASVVVVTLAVSLAGRADANNITNGYDLHWLDTDGNRIEAHGAGFLEYKGSWYWHGESKKTSNVSEHGVNCYSAPSLAGPWTSHGQVLTQDAIAGGKGVPSGPIIVERPKVVFNDETQEFVMWFHLDSPGYTWRHAGVATSKTPCGTFTFEHALQPDGIPSLDCNLWKDDDGQAYFVRSCDNSYTGISRLTPDYLNTTGLISKGPRFEGMAFMRLPNGTYFIVTSHLTGWNPNPLMLMRATGTSLDNPQWLDTGNPTHNATSFNTQPTYVVKSMASSSPVFVYMADNWIHCGPNGLIDACYVWLPFDPADMSLQWRPSWDLNNPFGR